MTELEAVDGREMALGIIDSFKTKYGVDLHEIISDSSLSTNEKIRKSQHGLLKAVLGRLGQDDRYRKEEHTESVDGFLYALAADVEVEPNVSFVPQDLPIILSYEGADVLTYLKTLTKRFELMTESTSSAQFAIELVASGLIGLGVPAGYAAIKAYRAGKTIKESALAGVKGIGLKTAIAIALVILVILVIFFILENPKKFFGMVINQTPFNLIVENWEKGVGGKQEGNLYMDHGTIKNFMQDQESLSSPQYQIKGGSFLDSPDDKLVFGGFYFADKRVGVYGTGGVMIFTSPDNSTLEVAHMFTCPYSVDNGTNMAVIADGPVKSIKTLYKGMYDTRDVNVAVTEGNYELQSRINDARGGIVGCIASIKSLDNPPE